MSGEEHEDPVEPGAPLWLVLAPGIRLDEAVGPPVPETVVQALAPLAAQGTSEEELEQAALDGGFEAATWLHVALEQLSLQGVLHHVVRGPSGELARLEPTRPPPVLREQAPEPELLLRLSRFASLRRDGQRMVLESPRARARVVLAGPALALVALLAEPRSLLDAAAQLPARERPAALTLWELLARAGFLVVSDEDGSTEEEREPGLALWEFHDLLFHARTRHRWHGQPVGGTYRLADTVAPLPVVQPPSGPVVELPRPELARLRREDPPLAEVMERRRSIRRFGTLALTQAQLGELFYRCARLREVLPGERQALSSRPYPSGGALYPLEVYAAVRDCLGLEPGLYRYVPESHLLERRSGMTHGVESLMRNPWPESPTPQAFFLLAARFPRVSWKYQSIAYSVVLKEAGVLLQSLSLAATAMGLASCILGYGDADVFERAAGTQAHLESSVAELAVGTLP